MGIYGIDFFGTDYYGPNPSFLPSTYSVAPFSAEAMGYTTFLLSWNKPTLLYPPVPQGTPQQATPGLKDSPTARVRLLRNTLNLPSDENDGVQLFDLPLAYSPVRWQDSPVVSGAFSYYTVFVFDGTLWQRAGDLIALAPNNFQYSQRLWELTPQVYHNWDYNFSDPTSTNPTVNQGPLQRFYGLMGLQFDLIRTELETLLAANDPKKCSGGLLPLLSNQLGLDYEPQMGMYLNRRLISNAIYHYKVKGTEPGLEGIVADISGWSSQITTGYNMDLDQNTAVHSQSLGGWTAHVSTGTVTLTQGSVPVGGGPSNPPILDGPITFMVATPSGAITGGGLISSTWTLFFQSASNVPPDPITLGVPLRQGATTVPGITLSRYVYPQNDHNFFFAVDFFDQSGNKIGATQTAPQLQAASHTNWTRVINSFTVPTTAYYLVYYLASTDSWVGGEKVWTTEGQVEAGAHPSPQEWQQARDIRICILPDRTNLVTNPSFETGVSPWGATTNCVINRSVTPGTTDRWPQLGFKSTSQSTGTQQIKVSTAGVPNNYLILVSITTYGNTNLTPPYGWAQISGIATGPTSSDLQQHVFWKVANNETNYTWFSSNVTPATTQVLGFYNTDPVDPVVASSSETGNSATVSVPSTDIPTEIATGTEIVFISTLPSRTIFPLGAASQETTVTAGNLIASDSSIETVSGPGTSAAANATLSNTAVWLGQNIIIKGSPLPAVPVSYQGTYSLQATSTAPGLMQVTSDPLPVIPGQYFSGSGYVIAESQSEPVQLFLNWLDQDTSPLDESRSSLIVQESTVGGQWVRPGVTAIAPAGASFATLTFQWNTTIGSGESHFLDSVLLEQAASVRSYFDGFTPLNGAAFLPPISADYLWANPSDVPEVSPSLYYKKRTQKNYRLTTTVPKYLPAGSTFTLLYGNVCNQPGGGPSPTSGGGYPHTIPMTIPN